MEKLKAWVIRNVGPGGVFLLSAFLSAFLGAYLGSYFTIQDQRELYKDHAAALQKVIRREAGLNLRTLRKSHTNLRGIETKLEAFIAGKGSAPSVGPGYLGLGIAGLRMQLESPSAYYVPDGLLVIYALVYDRLVRVNEAKRILDTAVMRYASAMAAREKQRAGKELLAAIRHHLAASEALTEEAGLPVLLKCLRQFSTGKEVCEMATDGP